MGAILRKNFTAVLTCLMLALLLQACGQEVASPTPTAQQPTTTPPPTSEASPQPTSTGVPATAAPVITETELPTVTPVPQQSTQPVHVSAANTPSTSLPVPCKTNRGTEVYLIVEGQRRHIVNWNTFLALGYKQADITDCGASAALPEGAPITRYFKGSGEEIFLLEQGVRRHIPDMATFTMMGGKIADVSILPDKVLTLWSAGQPVQPIALDAYPPTIKVYMVGAYTIEWYFAAKGMGTNNFATISAPNQPTIKVSAVDNVVLSYGDITGEGNPDVVFETTSAVMSGHCCWGTVVYDLGATPVKVLDIYSPAYSGSGAGRGEFIDIDGDGSDEFVTLDPIYPIDSYDTCTRIMTVLRYSPAQGRYGGASPQFAGYYENHLAELTASAQPSPGCQFLAATLLYIGRTADARAAFDRLYNGPDPDAYWALLTSAVQKARYYVPAQ